LTVEAIEAARWNPGVGCLVDRVHRDSPLIIAFGFCQFPYVASFDFFNRTKKLEKRFGSKYNRILVRDARNSWYHRGVPGLGADVDEVASTLRAMIHAVEPCRVFSIGQSMGGYAAIMFGMLLGVDRIAAFCPLSHLDPEEAARYGDLGFRGAMLALRDDPPRAIYPDLVRLGKSLGFRNELHVIFGTHPQQDDGLSSNFDAIHALRLAQLPNVLLHPYPEADHLVVSWLIENKQLDDLLARLIGEGECPDATPGRDREMRWRPSRPCS